MGLFTKKFTILTLFPSGFMTKNACEHHFVGSWQGVITFFARSSFTQALAGSLNLSGLATDSLNGVAFGFKKSCTCSESLENV